MRASTSRNNLTDTKNSKFANGAVLRVIGAAVFWVVVWYIAALMTDNPVLMPSPFDTASALVKICTEEVFVRSVLLTLMRVLTGFICGAVLGCVCGFSSYFSRTVRTILSPLLGMVRATPVASFILLAFVWFAAGVIPMVISALMVFPVVYDQVLAALDRADKSLFEVTAVFGWSFGRRMRQFYFPSVRGPLSASLITGFGLSWKAGVAAEVLCTPAFSIGRNLYQSKLYLETSELFAWTAVVVLLSILLEKTLIRRVAELAGGKHHKKVRRKISS